MRIVTCNRGLTLIRLVKFDQVILEEKSVHGVIRAFRLRKDLLGPFD